MAFLPLNHTQSIIIMDGSHLPSTPGRTLHPDVKREDIQAEEVVATWLKKLSARIKEAPFGDLSELFLDECWWRDIVALNGGFASKHGQENISSLLATAKNHLQDVQPIAYWGAQVRSGGICGHDVKENSLRRLIETLRRSAQLR